jgi:signal transduction histidine kinase
MLMVIALMLAAFVAQASWAAQTAPPAVQKFETTQFCETERAFDDTACHWKTIGLPHRWAPAGTGYRWSLYRIEVAVPAGTDLAVLAERLSLHARIRVNGQDLETPWPADDSSTALRFLRYWPQIFPILRDWAPDPTSGATESAATGQATIPLTIDIALQGHSDIKSGIGLLMIGPLGALQHLHWYETLLEVQLPLALAAASFMAGLFGLLAGGKVPASAHLLRLFSLVALMAAVRTALNYVIAPPMPAAVWAILNHWLLLSISVMTCAGIAVYLTGQSRRCLQAAVIGIVALAWLLVALPAGPLRYRGVEFVTLMLAALGLVLVVLLARRVLQQREPVGMALLAGLCVLILFGLHDLWVHLSADSQSDRYIQRWSTPALIIILILMLTRRVQAQRGLELRLAQETGHREELLRNLHDGIGSRLVALAFHARRQDPSGLLSEEIQNLMNELQMIQRAVRTEPTTLAQLLADQRHLYARVGGGRLPLHWDLAEGPGSLVLHPDQVLATLRIVDEAIANAMKHAQPERIQVILLPGTGPQAAILRIEDDGAGAFRIGSRGGLQNMRIRAQSAGLGLHFDAAPGAKAVVLRYSAPTQGEGLVARLRRAWGRRAPTANHRETP